MEGNSYLGSNSSFDLETSLSPRGKYLPPLGLPVETDCLISETSSTVDQSLESVVSTWKTKSSERKDFRRTSLYRQFDPLHSSSLILDKHPQQDFSTSTDTSKMPYHYLEAFVGDNQKDLVISRVSNFPPESALMSFESPKKLSMSMLKPMFNDETVSAKNYTEKEFNQILQAHELHLQGELLRKHHGLETSFTEKDQTLEHELCQTAKINNVYRHAITHITNILENMSSYNTELENKIKFTKNENEKLQNDIAMAKEDQCEWESTFADCHKRYEQCKSVTKTFKENGEILEKNIENLRLTLEEKDEKYDLLETKAQEITDKAQREIESVKKSADAEIAMLEAQLKKAEMKIYSLENDCKQVRLQNYEIGNICDDLMSKIGK